MKIFKSFFYIVCISFICFLFLYSEIHYEFINAKVVEIVDGDTIEVRVNNTNLKTRFFCIDTMESRNNAKLKRDLIKIRQDGLKVNKLILLSLGKEAKAFLSTILKKGSVVTLKLNTRKRTDKYGRLLAEVFYNNQNLNIIMIRKGFARVYFVGYVPKNIKVQYLMAEKEAKQERVGIWRYLYD